VIVLVSVASFMACWIGSIEEDGSEKPSASFGGEDEEVGAEGTNGSGRAEWLPEAPLVSPVLPFVSETLGRVVPFARSDANEAIRSRLGGGSFEARGLSGPSEEKVRPVGGGER
jgi:hypothetical protein